MSQNCPIGSVKITARNISTASKDPGSNMGEVLMMDVMGNNSPNTYWAGINFRLAKIADAPTKDVRAGYFGIQSLKNNELNNVKATIFSIWDINTGSATECTAEYLAPEVIASKFGGEGTGLKTLSYNNWMPNTWNTLALRRWSDQKGSTKIAAFKYDYTDYKWKHLATFKTPEDDVYFMDEHFDSFMEKFFDDKDPTQKTGMYRNWCKKDKANKWIYAQQAGIWKTPGTTGASQLVGSDQIWLNMCGATVDAKDMEYPITPSNTLRNFNGEVQPILDNKIALTGYKTRYSSNDNRFTTSWTIDAFKAPQLSYQVQIVDSYTKNIVYNSGVKYGPELRSDFFEFNGTPNASESYKVTLKVTDIFNNVTSESYNVSYKEPYGPNVALYPQKVTASSSWNKTFDAYKAFDGIEDSRWSSDGSENPNQYITVDLGKVYDINFISILWERAYAGKYLLMVSDDNTNWQTVYSEPDKKRFSFTNYTNDYRALNNVSGRYVRMQGLEFGPYKNYSIYSFRVYGTERVLPDGYYYINNQRSPKGRVESDPNGYNITWNSNASANPLVSSIFHIYKNSNNSYKIIQLTTGNAVSTNERERDSYFSVIGWKSIDNAWNQDYLIVPTENNRNLFYIYSPGVGDGYRLQCYSTTNTIGFERNNNNNEQIWSFSPINNVPATLALAKPASSISAQPQSIERNTDNQGIIGLPVIANRIYPNPVRTSLTVESLVQLKKIQIYSQDGKIVLEKTCSGQIAQLSTVSLAGGLYMVVITKTDGSKTVEKLMKY